MRGPVLLYGSKSTINKIATTLLLHQKGPNIMGRPESCPAWRIGRAGAEENFKKVEKLLQKVLTDRVFCGIMLMSSGKPPTYNMQIWRNWQTR